MDWSGTGEDICVRNNNRNKWIVKKEQIKLTKKQTKKNNQTSKYAHTSQERKTWRNNETKKKTKTEWYE